MTLRFALQLSTALLAGAILVGAFAPFSLGWFAPLPLALVFGVGMTVRPLAAAAAGYVFGVGLFGVGVNWIHVAVEIFGASPFIAWAAALGLAALLAVFPATAFGLAAWAGARAAPLTKLALWPALWTLSEWLRGWLLTGFGWLQLGYAPISSDWVQWIAPFVGVLGVGSVIAVVAAGLAAITVTRRAWPALATGVLWVGLYALPGPAQPIGTDATGGSITILLVQGDIAQTRKWRADEREAIIDQYCALSAPYWDRADLIVWPETAIPAVYVNGRSSPYVELAHLVNHHRARLIAGTLRRGDGDLYNSMIDIGSGQASDKRHLVPFGEYVPFGEWLRPLLGDATVPAVDFAAAHATSTLPVAGARVGLPICYEIAFARDVRPAAAPSGLLVNASDDVWFGRSIGLWQNREIARMRAIETGRPVARATNTGLTAVIGADGSLNATIAPFRPGVLQATIKPRAGITPFVRWGNGPLVGFWAGIVLAVVVGRKRFHVILT
ncbi:apolipoprotein N-acyltransferase [Salinisphaera dokdonensis CL-ES53]|uniref:Apolipoprotein N-acyltransferase n=1 Tax=Salinisphaera dokdonensis CL-ES53 TaxID=1304272 RepID=A0ABV2B3J8_9GAMM